MLDERKVGSASVSKHADGLSLRAGDSSESLAGRIKHQRSALREYVRMDPEPCGSWQTKDQSSGSLMDICLDSGGDARCKILLRIATVSVDTFPGKPAVEMIAVTNQETTRLSATLRRTLTSRVLCK